MGYDGALAFALGVNLMHALVFDLDGTLVDSVYAHVLAWQAALSEVGVHVDGYRLHRHVGSSGDLIVRYAQREAGHTLSTEEAETVRHRHGELFRQMMPRPRPLPGAVEVFRALRTSNVPYAIATASYRPLIDASLQAVGVGPEAIVIEGKGALRASRNRTCSWRVESGLAHGPRIASLWATRSGIMSGPGARAC
jgi:phosphoglycolate phosphatase-like HAD superfamily hydrolase